MVRKRLIVMAACTMVGCDIAKSVAQDFPAPEVYIRAEDQERARMFRSPCAEADIGRGCYRFGDRAFRYAPCTYSIDAMTSGSLPTDQCYKMEGPRRYRGIWVDEFEGQAFIPEGTTAPKWPSLDPTSPGWREQFDRAQAATIWLDVDRVKLEHDYRNGSRKMRIEFIGRKTMYPGWYGHMGLSGHEIIVDRVISLEECPKSGICG